MSSKRDLYRQFIDDGKAPYGESQEEVFARAIIKRTLNPATGVFDESVIVDPSTVLPTAYSNGITFIGSTIGLGAITPESVVTSGVVRGGSITATGTGSAYGETLSLDKFNIDGGPWLPRLITYGPNNSTIGWMVFSASSLDGSHYQDFFTYNDAGDGSGPRFYDPQGLSVWTIGDGDQIVIKPNNTSPSLDHYYHLYISNEKLTADHVWNFPNDGGTFVGLDTTQVITNKQYVGQKLNISATGAVSDGHSLVVDRYDPGDGSFVHRISAHGPDNGTKGRLVLDIATADAGTRLNVLLALNTGAVSMPFMNTNGFVKTSGGDGTLSVLAPAVFATGASHTVDELITVLQTAGIFKQS